MSGYVIALIVFSIVFALLISGLLYVCLEKRNEVKAIYQRIAGNRTQGQDPSDVAL